MIRYDRVEARGPSFLRTVSGAFGGAVILLFLVCISGAQAVTFDWDQSYASTWTGGSADHGTTATQSYSAVDTDHAGTDVTISIINNNTRSSADFVDGFPAVDNSRNTGGTSPAQNALQLPFSGNNRSGITVKIDFNYTYGVNNVVITLWDVDYYSGQYNDVISQIKAVTVSGQTVYATTITDSSANNVYGTGSNSYVAGTTLAAATSSAGNVIITFSTSEAITSVSFTWGNSDTNYGQQAIALGDFSYTPAVPETASGVVALIACALAVIGREIYRRRRTAYFPV